MSRRSGVDPRPVQWRVKLMDRVVSTQNVAAKLAEKGAPEGTVVVAKTQTAGRGRMGRTWVSPAGGLYMSIVLRPSTSSEPHLLSLVAAVSTVRGINSATGLKTMVRWPNDVMVRNRKLTGILTESGYSGSTISSTIVGIGVNCNSRVRRVGGQNLATSLAEELGQWVRITAVRREILSALGGLYVRWTRGFDVVKDARRHVGTIGRQVVVRTKSGKELEGLAEDIEGTWGLVIRREGLTSVIHAEDIEWLRETTS